MVIPAKAGIQGAWVVSMTHEHLHQIAPPIFIPWCAGGNRHERLLKPSKYSELARIPKERLGPTDADEGRSADGPEIARAANRLANLCFCPCRQVDSKC